MPYEQRPPIVDDDPDAPGPPISVADSHDTGETGKLRMIVTLLKKALGVKDIAAMRLSLPASLLEPIPNLEYWSYCDRPDLFADINDSSDSFERLLAVLRFMFSKDIKFVHGKICKPYNSVLGEFFLAHWDVIPVSYPSNDRTEAPIQHLFILSPGSETSTTEVAKQTQQATSIKPNISTKAANSTKSRVSALSVNGEAPSPTLSVVESNLAAGISDLSLAAPSERSLLEADSIASGDSSIEDRLRVTFLTEQISHHPPISAYHYSVPSKGVSACGVDQIAARVSGTTVKISPGLKNKGIFISIDDGPGEGETYQITHPSATVNGILTGRFYATVTESSIVTIRGGENWRVVIEYKEEAWLGAAKFLVEGVVHTIEPGNTVHESWTKIKHVPIDKVIARIDGNWKGELRYRRVEEEEWKTLINLTNITAIPKAVRPLEQQLPNESRKLWEGVTSNLIKKEFSEATKIKQNIEQTQRDKAAIRKKNGERFVPVYFEADIESGAPILTSKGREMLEKEAARRS